MAQFLGINNTFTKTLLRKRERLTPQISLKGIGLPEVVWQQCVNRLQEELPSQQFNTWIRPLQASIDGQQLRLYAPNRFIKEFVSDKFAERISELVRELGPEGATSVVLEIGAIAAAVAPVQARTLPAEKVEVPVLATRLAMR